MDIKTLAGVAPDDMLLKLGMTRLPYDPFAVAEQLGVEVVSTVDANCLDLSGTCSLFDGELSIWINPLQTSYHRRFAMAHQLGHLIYDVLPAIDSEACVSVIDWIDPPEVVHPDERRANNFADQLLMPGMEVIEASKREINLQAADNPKASVDSDALFMALAKIFDVSKQMIERRMRALGLL